MIGKTISHYKILEKLGEGGMGEVYLAEDTKLDRTVAIKFLRPEAIGDPTAKERFIREAKAASALNHRNISTIYEIDESKGRDFICMEYVEGRTLKQLTMNNDQLSVETIIDYGIQAAEALQAAHEKDIIHRDIKSDNIMVTEKGEVKVMDFGLAKFKETSTMTKTGTTVGTISYMSPEQTRGEKVNHQSDIWSLGVVLYEMLSGQLPFKGDYETAVIYSILNQTQKPITDLRMDVPKSLETVVNNCLEKSPSDRYQHSEDVIADLQGLYRDSDTKIRSLKPDSGGDYLQKWSLSKKMLIFLLILLVFIMVGYLVLNRIIINESSQSGVITDTQWKNSIGILPFENVSADPALEEVCDIIINQILISLSRLPDLKIIGPRSVGRSKKSLATIPDMGEKFNVENILESNASLLGDQIRIIIKLVETNEGVQLWAENYDIVYDLDGIYTVIDNTTEKIAKALIKNLSTKDLEELKSDKPRNFEAFDYYNKGYHFFHKRFSSTRNEKDFKNSETMFKKAIELDPTYIPSYLELADLYTTYGWYVAIAVSYKEREAYWAQADSIRKLAYDLDPNSAEAILAMGVLYDHQEQSVKAFEKFKLALELNPNWITANHRLAQHLEDVGLYDVALKYRKRIVELDPLWPDAYINRAFWGYSCQGDYEKAEADFRVALDLDPNHQEALGLYSMFLIRTKKYEKAKEYCTTWSKVDTSALLPRAFVQAFDGNIEEAINLTKKFEGTSSGIIYMQKYWIFTVLGMEDEAFEYLNMHGELFAETGWTLYFVLVNDPIYDNFRDNPHFQALLAKHKKLYEENLVKYGFD